MLTEVALSVAIRVTFWIDVTDPAVELNVVEAELAGTVTEAGTGSADGLFDESATVVPFVGAF